MEKTPVILDAIATLRNSVENNAELAALARLEIALFDKDEKPARVKIIDEKTQYFNGFEYYQDKSTGYYMRYSKKIRRKLHVDVYIYYNGTIPEGYDVHHCKTDADGNFDKSKNNIEDLQLLSHREHAKLHRLLCPRKPRQCPHCGKIFYSRGLSTIFCCRKCQSAASRKAAICAIQSECIVCGKTFSTSHYRPRKTCSRSCASKLGRHPELAAILIP